MPRFAKAFGTSPMHKANRFLARRLGGRSIPMRNQGPLVSITLDDAPETAFLNGAPLLESAGARGTFYISAGLCGQADTHWSQMTRDQVGELHDRGHEIGCHTFSHLNVQTLSAAALEGECRANREALRQIRPKMTVTSFAYPYGDVGWRQKLRLERAFASCRGTQEGIMAGHVDPGLLKAVELYETTLSPGKIARVLDETVRRNGWAVFFGHDVTDDPSPYGCSPGLLERLLRETARRSIRVSTVREALDLVGANGS